MTAPERNGLALCMSTFFHKNRPYFPYFREKPLAFHLQIDGHYSPLKMSIMATQESNPQAGSNNQDPTQNPGQKPTQENQKGIEQNDHTREGNNDATMHPNKEKIAPENQDQNANSPGTSQGDNLRSEGAFERLQQKGKDTHPDKTSPDAQPDANTPGYKSNKDQDNL